MLQLKELYQDTILEHGQNPRNFGEMKKADFSTELFNPLCGDRYQVYLKVNKGKIKGSSFEGEGCLISKASASMMTEILRDKKIREAVETFQCFKGLVTGEKIECKTNLEKLVSFSGISKFPVRIKCALLPWYALQYIYVKKMHSMS